MLRERDEEIEKLKKELNSYRKKLKEGGEVGVGKRKHNPILKVHILGVRTSAIRCQGLVPF